MFTLRVTKSVFLLTSFLFSVYAVDLAPPEVPNPYFTSEGRAIRDHMEETYKIKLSDKLSLDELRSLYRKKWNEDQENRYLNSNQPSSADPAWVKTYLNEEDAVLRAKWTDIIKKMGVQAPEDATIDQLRDLAAKTQRDQEAAAQAARSAELAKRQEEMAKQLEREAANKPQVTAQQPKNNEERLTPILTAQEIMTDSHIINAFRLHTKLPTDTQRQRDDIESKAKILVEQRELFKTKNKATPIMTSNAGVEVWYFIQSTSDPEISYPVFFVLNLTPKFGECTQIEVSFVGSTRNSAQAYSPKFASFSYLDTRKFDGKSFFVDPMQKICIDVMTIKYFE